MVTRRFLFGLLVAACAAARLKSRPSPAPEPRPFITAYTGVLAGGECRLVSFTKDGFVVEWV